MSAFRKAIVAIAASTTLCLTVLAATTASADPLPPEHTETIQQNISPQQQIQGPAFRPADDAAQYYPALHRYWIIMGMRDTFWRSAKDLNDFGYVPKLELLHDRDLNTAKLRVLITMLQAEGDSQAREINPELIGSEPDQTRRAVSILHRAYSQAATENLRSNGGSNTPLPPHPEIKKRLSWLSSAERYFENYTDEQLPLDTAPYLIANHGLLGNEIPKFTGRFAEFTITENLNTSDRIDPEQAKQHSEQNLKLLDTFPDINSNPFANSVVPPFPQPGLSVTRVTVDTSHNPWGDEDHIAFIPAPDASSYYPELNDHIRVYTLRSLYYEAAVRQHKEIQTPQSEYIVKLQYAMMRSAKIRMMTSVLRAEGDSAARSIDITSGDSMVDALSSATLRIELAYHEVVSDLHSHGSDLDPAIKLQFEQRQRWLNIKSLHPIPHTLPSPPYDSGPGAIYDFGIEERFLPKIPAELNGLKALKTQPGTIPYREIISNSQDNLRVLEKLNNRDANPYPKSTLRRTS